MKKGIAMTLTLIGMVFIILGILGAFGQIELGTYTWILLILGIIFFPAGIGLMKSSSSS